MSHSYPSPSENIQVCANNVTVIVIHCGMVVAVCSRKPWDLLQPQHPMFSIVSLASNLVNLRLEFFINKLEDGLSGHPKDAGVNSLKVEF